MSGDNKVVCALLPFQRGPLWLVRLLTEHMLPGGRQGGQEGDGTDKNVQRVGGAKTETTENEDLEEVGRVLGLG